MRGVLLAATAALLAAPGLAVADSEHAADVAAALERDPVYVAPARAEKLPIDAAGRIRLRILRKAIGRIKIAIVPGAWAASSGGAREFANAVDAELPARGALLVVADRAAHVVTSHDHADAAASGVGRAVGAAVRSRTSCGGRSTRWPKPTRDPRETSAERRSPVRSPCRPFPTCPIRTRSSTRSTTACA